MSGDINAVARGVGEAFGIDLDDVIHMSLDMTVGEIPTLSVVHYVWDATEAIEVLKKYELKAVAS